MKTPLRFQSRISTLAVAFPGGAPISSNLSLCQTRTFKNYSIIDQLGTEKS